MGRSGESFSKKEREKKRQKKKEEKAKKKEERKGLEGGGFDSMIAYVDEFGNIVDTPPDPKQKEEIDPETIQLGAAVRLPEEKLACIGVVDFFNDEKGFGFIKQDVSGESIFFHISGTIEDVGEGNRVTYETEQGEKGPVAVQVKKV